MTAHAERSRSSIQLGRTGAWIGAVGATLHISRMSRDDVLQRQMFAARVNTDVCITILSISSARHFEPAGFETILHEAEDVAAVRAAAGVSAGLGGCHTGKIAVYVVEGHLPVMALQRLLAERPAVLGLAVSGMESEGKPGEPLT